MLLIRLIGFELKGLASVVLWITGRRHGVPPGATVVTYSRGQTAVLAGFLVVMVAELIGVEMLLRALGAPPPVRIAFLVIDAYGVLFCLGMMASCVTRPHVVSDGELRIRYGYYLDVRVPRDRIASVRRVDNRNERGTVAVADGVLVTAVFSQTNLVIELDEPVTFTRPLGRRASVRTIRFFADEPNLVPTVSSPHRS
jgi:hypothetical protein